MSRLVIKCFFLIVCSSLAGCRTPSRTPSNHVFQESDAPDYLVTYQWIEDSPDIPNGSGVDKVSELLGGPPHSTNFDKNTNGPAFWHFSYSDGFDNELYMVGEARFKSGKVEFFSWTWRHPKQNGGKNYHNKILLTEAELVPRAELVKTGLSLTEVNRLLGGQPCTGYLDKNGNGKAFWRFLLSDAKTDHGKWAFYMGEFRKGKFERGYFLPG
jgi:hypothetical protein